ncbi:MAG: glycosyltransferase family 39 protein [Candidatus Pacebacteria bacterium]|nr:glycosyltransferase family 39 protein [Candidatus Paceibacterota bacterium]
MLRKFFKWLTRKKQLYYWLAVAIFLLSAYLRFAHLNWDKGLALHPDERNIAAAVARLDWPQKTDPEFYAYNGFPLFLTDISSQVISYLSNDLSWQTDYGKINLITRSYSAIFSLIAVFFVYLIAKKLFSKKTAILITFLAASTVTFIQHAHFGVTESLLLLEMLILSYLSIQLIETKNKKLILLMAILSGFSLGTKTTAMSFIFIPALSIILTYRWHLKTLLKLIIYGLLSFLFFYLVSPNTFNYLPEFLSTMKYEQAVVSGQQSVFYTMQFIDTIPYLFQIKTLLWLTSPVVLLAAGWGLFIFLKNIKKYQTLWPLIFFSFIYFLYVGSWFAKFNRYLILVVPSIIFLTGIALDQCQKKRFGKIVAVMLLLFNALWAGAFFKIYQNEHVRITASAWIESNLAEDSLILHEERDERLPIITNDKTFQYSLLELYQADSLEKVEHLAKQLAEGDYLIIASQRLFRTIPRSQEHPYTSHYYQLLFAEQVGYQKIREFHAYPNLLGITIKDDGAEETFRVFDHPSIYIFQNTKQFQEEELMELISDLD